jgi:hypothetical protein
MAKFHILGIPVTVDFRAPLSEQQLHEASERFRELKEASKAAGDQKPFLKFGTDLIERGYVYSPSKGEWEPAPDYCPNCWSVLFRGRCPECEPEE